MTKLDIFGQVVLFAGIAISIAAGANQPRSTTTSGKGTPTGTTMNARERGGFERFNDPELLEYFESADEKEGENEAHAASSSASPRSNPVFFIEDSMWKNFDDDKVVGEPNSNSWEPKESLLQRLYRRLSLFLDDNSKIDYFENNPYGYTNYHKEEVEYHEEELITDDDDWGVKAEYIFDDDPLTSVPTSEWPTILGTPLGSSYWDGLDAYDQIVQEEDAATLFAETEISDAFNFVDNESEDITDSESEDITDTDILLDRPDNSIVLRLALGVVKVNEMTHDDHMGIVGMALRTMTVVLNHRTDLPFAVFDNLVDSRRRRNRRRKLGDEDEPRPQFRNTGFDGDEFTDDNSWENKDDDGDVDEYLAMIVLENVVVEQGDHNWWEMSAIYSVWRNFNANYDDNDEDNDNDKNRWLRALQLQEEDKQPQEEEHQKQQWRRQAHFSPVKRRTILKRIEGMCANAIENSIQNDVYWETLGSIRYGNQDMVLDQKIFFRNEMGIADVKGVGDEYNLGELFCPLDRPLDDAGFVCPVAALAGSNAYHYDKNRVGIDDKIASMSNDTDCCCGTYPDAIAESIFEIEWGAREWVGFGLMVSTVFSVVILSVTAHLVSQKRQRQVLWGAALTPTGVDDILQVGWRVYEQPQGQQPLQAQAPGDLRDLQHQQQQQQQLQHHQLFLQIYDKGQGQGYNDENSLLRGGVEQRLFAPPVAPLPLTS